MLLKGSKPGHTLVAFFSPNLTEHYQFAHHYKFPSIHSFCPPTGKIGVIDLSYPAVWKYAYHGPQEVLLETQKFVLKKTLCAIEMATAVGVVAT
jgi:hypothetical protein